MKTFSKGCEESLRSFLEVALLCPERCGTDNYIEGNDNYMLNFKQRGSLVTAFAEQT